ncbi:hypothetical protein AT15_05970 [Kosmotoga arenicorallina S304]|uniref:PAS domain-containing protein n=1 Tax=Kosmotoga arenicorallina S304 TaxID=1453497 RepID=A0A176K3P5_9BACT|nr:GAF domain-containing protein [Kosmotoga arenicorallina]OAA31617.1 hypothetical protein AT15_05970 [Kosmotoga arenicorallina S304]
MFHEGTNKDELLIGRFISGVHLNLLDLIDEIVIIFLIDSMDSPGQIVYANKMAVELLGYSLEDLLNKSFYDLAEDIPTDIKVRKEERFNCELTAFSGSYLSLLGSISFIKHSERNFGVFIGKDRSKITKLLSELQWRIDFESLISKISSMFVGLFDFDNSINRALAAIGTFTGADRAYLFLFDEERNSISNTHEWCAKGIKPEKERLQNLPVDMFPWWMRKLKSGKILNIEEVAKLPEEASAEREILQAQNIKSLIVLPVFAGKELAGFVGLDDVDRDIPWQEGDIKLLRIFSEILSRAFEIKYYIDDKKRGLRPL